MSRHLTRDQVALTLLLVWVVSLGVAAACYRLWPKHSRRLEPKPELKYTRRLQKRLQDQRLRARQPVDVDPPQRVAMGLRDCLSHRFWGGPQHARLKAECTAVRNREDA